MSDYLDLMENENFKEAFEMFCQEYGLEVSEETFEETYRGYFTSNYDIALYLIEDQYAQDISSTMSDVWNNLNYEGVIDDYERYYDVFCMNGYLFRA